MAVDIDSPDEFKILKGYDNCTWDRLAQMSVQDEIGRSSWGLRRIWDSDGAWACVIVVFNGRGIIKVIMGEAHQKL